MDEFEKTEDLTVRQLVPKEKLGIDTLPAQLVKKRIEEGFAFNILFVGETGIGKSTLASSLFNIPVSSAVENHTSPGVKMNSTTRYFCEKVANVRLTIIETTGYGDQINREDNVIPITQYIESQFEMYFKEELKIKRSLSLNKDTRVHSCIYFICPTGHNLKSLDIFCMKQLHDKVNLIPIIAKSDSLSADELKQFKTAIKAAIERHNIKIYCFPTDDENDLIPFAVAASGDYASVEGNLMRARTFPWGKMLVECEKHSEFLALKRALIEVNLEDMREKTNNKFYEAYRKMRLLHLGCSVSEKEPLITQELFENMRKKQQKEILEEEEKLNETFSAKVRAKEDEFNTEMNAITSKYNTLFQQLRNEQDSVNRLRNKLELEYLNFKREVQKNEKSKNKRR